MRTINDHKVNSANDKLEIAVEDEPGAGGANHRYSITGFDTNGNPSNEDSQGYKASWAGSRYTKVAWPEEVDTGESSRCLWVFPRIYPSAGDWSNRQAGDTVKNRRC